MKKYGIVDNIILEKLENETILISMKTCLILRLNHEGGHIWSLIRTHDNAEDILRELQTEDWNLECTLEDIEDFLELLEKKGMLYEKI